MGLGSVRYVDLQDFQISFSPGLEEFLHSRSQVASTVLSGPNNQGKSLVLKMLRAMLGDRSYLIGCNRFYHIDVLRSRQIDEYEYRTDFDAHMRSLLTSRQNTEENRFNLEQIFTELTDLERDKLLTACGDMLGNRLEMKPVMEGNILSPYYIDMDGENLRYGSTGTRLLLTLVGICMSPRYNTVLIDEPELGLSPRIQAKLASYLFHETLRSEFFPNLQCVYVSTHSHIFIDRHVLTNNFYVSKDKTEITITPLASVSDLHALQFNMLGNDLSALFLPSAIVIVEGQTDYRFINRMLKLHLPNERVTVLCGRKDSRAGESEIPEQVHLLSRALGDLSRSPYQERIFPIFDSEHDPKNVYKCTKQGIPIHNIVIWEKNGIEYYYPKDILCDLFSCSEFELERLTTSPKVIVGSIEYDKTELCEHVVDRLSVNSHIHDEVQKKLLTRLAQILT